MISGHEVWQPYSHCLGLHQGSPGEVYREYFTRTAIAAQSWIAVLDLPSRTAIDRSPESRTAIQDCDEIAFAVLIAVLVAVLIAVLIAVLDF